MKFLITSTLILIAATANAQDGTYLATGIIAPMYGYPWGTLAPGATPKVGETLQFEYTVGVLPPFLQVGPNPIGITAVSYSVNGSPFYSDLGYGTGDAGGFLLYPGNGAEIALNASTMLVYDLAGDGAFANTTSIKEISPTGAPEIDPASAFSGLALLLGGVAVLRGRRAPGRMTMLRS